MFWRLFWLGLFSGVAVYVSNFLISMDVNKLTYNQRPGPCRQLKGIEYGSEDFAVLEDLGLAFITSGMWYLNERPAAATGKIFLFDFNRPEMDPIELPIVGMPHSDKFHPHGITHWREETKVFLYAISHQSPDFSHTVEVLEFDVEKRQLRYVRTLKDDKFVRPNTLVAVGKDKLIVANDGAAQTQLAMLFEFLLGRKTGSLVYFDGKETHWLAQGMSSTTAVAVDRQMKHLFVGQVNDKAMTVYELSSDLKGISEISRLRLRTALDNFYVDPDDVIWLAAHPVVKDLFVHVGQVDDPKSHAPSQVLRVVYSKDWKTAQVHQVFADDGRLISASSSAAFYKDKLLIGSMARQAVLCDVLYSRFD